MKEEPVKHQNGTAHKPLNIVILCAGRGSRLKNMTDEMPKCLIEVAGQAIIGRMLSLLSGESVNQIIIVVGYLQGKIRDYVGAYFPELSVKFVENPEFIETGSIVSLQIGLDRIPDDESLLIVEGDVVLEPALLMDMVLPPGGNHDSSTLLAPYTKSLSGTFAIIEEGQVLDWAHETMRDRAFPLEQSYKTVNITHVSAGTPVSKLKGTIRHVIEEQGRMAPLEYAMQHLIANGMAIEAVLTRDRRWFEIDDQDDLAIALTLFTENNAGKITI